MNSIPPGWVQLPDGSYSPPSAIAKGLVRGTPATNEGQLHDEILAWCRAKGFPVVHSRMDRPSTSGIGTPDFVVALPKGQTVWVEAKTAKGKRVNATDLTSDWNRDPARGVRIITNGKGEMPSFKSKLSAGEIRSVFNYVARF